MPISVAPLRQYAWGREDTTAKGVSVAGTSLVAVENIDFEPLDAVNRPRLARGLMLDNPGNEFVTMRGTKWTAKGPLIYDQLQNWLEMTVQGCLVAAGSAPSVWTAAWDPTTVAALASFTLQRRITEGANPIDSKFLYALAQSLHITAAADAPLMMEVVGFARRIQSATLTSSLALPTVEIPPIALSKLFIDTSWAGLGGTQVVGQVLSWDVLIKNGAKPIPTADGRTDLDFTTHIIDGREAGIEFNCMLMVKADSGQYATEKTAAEAQSLRAVSIETLGSSSRALKVQFLGKHATGSLFKVDEQDGYDVVAVKLVSSSDGTHAFQLVLSNTVGTLI